MPRNIKYLRGLSCIKQFIFLSYYYNETPIVSRSSLWNHLALTLSVTRTVQHWRYILFLKKEKMRPRGVVLMEAFNLPFSEEIALWEEIPFQEAGA